MHSKRLAALTPDEYLKRLLRERLTWDKRVSAYDVHIDVLDGQVTLNGMVDTLEKKRAALEVIKTTEGVWSVRDQITVDSGMCRTDKELSDILVQVLCHLRLKPGEEIKILVNDGAVCLDGVVFRSRLKGIADSLAWELSCVKDVFNLIQLKKDPPNSVTIEPMSNEEFFHYLQMSFPPGM